MLNYFTISGLFSLRAFLTASLSMSFNSPNFLNTAGSSLAIVSSSRPFLPWWWKLRLMGAVWLNMKLFWQLGWVLILMLAPLWLMCIMLFIMLVVAPLLLPRGVPLSLFSPFAYSWPMLLAEPWLDDAFWGEAVG